MFQNERDASRIEMRFKSRRAFESSYVELIRVFECDLGFVGYRSCHFSPHKECNCCIFLEETAGFFAMGQNPGKYLCSTFVSGDTASMRHQNRNGHRPKEAPRSTAEN